MFEVGKNISRHSGIKFKQEVRSFVKKGNGTIIHTSSDTFLADKVIFCTGLQSDRFAQKDSVDLEVRVIPFRGDYFILKPDAFHKVKNLIFLLADPNLPFLGVHITRMMNGTIECGPNAVFSFEREGYQKLSFDIKDSNEARAFEGSWKLFGKIWNQGVQEYYRSFSKRKFLKLL